MAEADQKARLAEWEEEILSAMTGSQQWSGAPWTVRCYREIPTTMDAARALSEEVLPSRPLIVLAERQSSGRGRQGRRWESPTQGFFGTFAFRAQREVAALAGLSLVVGTVLVDLMESLSCTVGLKWPNDVLDRQGRKVSGTLIELAPAANGTVVLIGIGINLVGQPDTLRDEAVSVLGLSGRAVRAAAIAVRLAPMLWQAWQRFETEGFSAFNAKWIKSALFVDSELTVDVGNGEVVRGIFRGVDDQGCMLLEVGGAIRSIAAGHVLER